MGPQVLEVKNQPEVSRLATELMEQSGLIELPSAMDDDTMECLGLWLMCAEFQKEGDISEMIFDVLCTSDVDARYSSA